MKKDNRDLEMKQVRTLQQFVAVYRKYLDTNDKFADKALECLKEMLSIIDRDYYPLSGMSVLGHAFIKTHGRVVMTRQKDEFKIISATRDTVLKELSTEIRKLPFDRYYFSRSNCSFVQGVIYTTSKNCSEYVSDVTGKDDHLCVYCFDSHSSGKPFSAYVRDITVTAQGDISMYVEDDDGGTRTICRDGLNKHHMYLDKNDSTKLLPVQHSGQLSAVIDSNTHDIITNIVSVMATAALVVADDKQTYSLIVKTLKSLFESVSPTITEIPAWAKLARGESTTCRDISSGEVYSASHEGDATIRLHPLDGRFIDIMIPQHMFNKYTFEYHEQVAVPWTAEHALKMLAENSFHLRLSGKNVCVYVNSISIERDSFTYHTTSGHTLTAKDLTEGFSYDAGFGCWKKCYTVK